MKPAVVLFSGGLDSSTCLAIAREDGFAPHALAVRYGQRHAHELRAAERVAAALAVPLKVVEMDLRAIGGSALTGELAVPKDAPLGQGIPVTYVPARNTVLLALALGYAEVLGAQDLYIGVNARLPARVRARLRGPGEPGHQGGRGRARPLLGASAARAAFQGGDHPARDPPPRPVRADAFVL